MNKHTNKKRIVIIIFIILSIVSLIGGLNLYKKHILGWEKDCKPYVLDNYVESDFPDVCKDFSKYHLLMIGGMGLIGLAGAFLVIIVALVDTNSIENKEYE